jgi:hypothetical protein
LKLNPEPFISFFNDVVGTLLQMTSTKVLQAIPSPRPDDISNGSARRPRMSNADFPPRSKHALRDIGRRMSKTHMDGLQRPTRDRYLVAEKMRELEDEYQIYTRISGYSRGPEMLMAFERLRSKSHL